MVLGDARLPKSLWLVLRDTMRKTTFLTKAVSNHRLHIHGKGPFRGSLYHTRANIEASLEQAKVRKPNISMPVNPHEKATLPPHT